MDDIIVVKQGRIIEHGSFKQLMSNKGHLATLVGEHVQVLDEIDNFEQENNDNTDKMSKEAVNYHLPPPSSRRSSSHEYLTHEQMVNRSRLSISQNLIPNDHNLAMHIESHQLTLIGSELSRNNSIKLIERNRMSICTTEDEPMPDDAEPMKLVLEDQSIYYKKSPLVAYLQAGVGVTMSLLIFALFYFVHLVRIGSGKFHLIQIKKLYLCWLH